MNERLTELYRECRTKEALASQDEYKSSNTLLGLEVEKFAELIVRECAQVCRNQSNIYALKADRDNCAIAIEEHFGVGE